MSSFLDLYLKYDIFIITQNVYYKRKNKIIVKKGTYVKIFDNYSYGVGFKNININTLYNINNLWYINKYFIEVPNSVLKKIVY